MTQYQIEQRYGPLSWLEYEQIKSCIPRVWKDMLLQENLGTYKPSLYNELKNVKVNRLLGRFITYLLRMIRLLENMHNDG